MTLSSADVVDRLVAIEPGSPLDVSRRRNPDTRANIQASYLALFEPSETDAMTLAERFAVAVYVCALHDQEREVDFYRQGLTGRRSERCPRVDHPRGGGAGAVPRADRRLSEWSARSRKRPNPSEHRFARHRRGVGARA